MESRLQGPNQFNWHSIINKSLVKPHILLVPLLLFLFILGVRCVLSSRLVIQSSRPSKNGIIIPCNPYETCSNRKKNLHQIRQHNFGITTPKLTLNNPYECISHHNTMCTNKLLQCLRLSKNSISA